ncbi:MAG: hypothetical protein ACK49O_07380 [Bacteroidota bacterium]
MITDNISSEAENSFRYNNVSLSNSFIPIILRLLRPKVKSGKLEKRFNVISSLKLIFAFTFSLAVFLARSKIFPLKKIGTSKAPITMKVKKPKKA